MRVLWVLTLGSIAAATVGGTLAVTGCGGDSDDTSTAAADPERAAQVAVADFMRALADGDPASACDLLTEDAQQGLVDAQTEQVPAQLRGDTCDEVLQVIVDAPRGATALDAVGHFAEEIRTGDVPHGSVSVAIAEGAGTVTITAGKSELPVSVEEVDGAWLVANANTLVFGVL